MGEDSGLVYASILLEPTCPKFFGVMLVVVHLALAACPGGVCVCGASRDMRGGERERDREREREKRERERDYNYKEGEMTRDRNGILTRQANLMPRQVQTLVQPIPAFSPRGWINNHVWVADW
jgi:hypothetical protein